MYSRKLKNKAEKVNGAYLTAGERRIDKGATLRQEGAHRIYNAMYKG